MVIKCNDVKTIKSRNKLRIGMMLILILVSTSMIYNALATVYPSYDTEQDCRSCHAKTNTYIANRHHILVANNSFSCSDCHAMKYDEPNQTYEPEVIRDCLICHPGKSHLNTHHIFVAQGLFVCSDCHPLQYDEINQTYEPKVTWECTECHSTVLSIQNVTPTPTPTPTPIPIPPIPPSITSFNPISPVRNTVGDSREFRITTDQAVNVTWLIGDNQVRSDENVYEANYTNISVSLGQWNVSAIASNTNGTVKYTWTWNVEDVIRIPPVVTFYAPYSPTTDIESTPKKFGISVDQIANIVWYFDGIPIQSNNSVMAASYTNIGTSPGEWNVTVNATNINGSVLYSWIWNVIPASPPTTLIDSPNGMNGWYKTNPIYLNVTDYDGIKYTNYSIDGINYSNPGSGQSLITPLILSEGSHTIQYYSVDNLGSTESTKTQNVNIDMTSPIITASATAGGNPYTSGVWTNQDVIVSFTCSDVLSNVASCSSPITLSGEGANQEAIGYATDQAGNSASAAFPGISIDKTAPTMKINSPVNGNIYVLNQNLVADWSVSDTTSGIAMATGTYPNGSIIDTSSPGTKYFVVNARDNAGAGNINNINVTYYIHYNFGQFLEPIKNDSTSIFKLGSMIPIKFQLSDANGYYVTNAIAKLNLTKITATVTGLYLEPYATGSATTGDIFIYETNGNKYSYNLATRSLSVGTWRIRVDINDGSSYYVDISIKK